MDQTDETIRNDIKHIVWVLWPKHALTAEEIHREIRQQLNHPWSLEEVAGQLDALVRSGEFARAEVVPPTYTLGAWTARQSG
jgi:hypothetical protein